MCAWACVACGSDDATNSAGGKAGQMSSSGGAGDTASSGGKSSAGGGDTATSGGKSSAGGGDTASSGGPSSAGAMNGSGKFLPSSVFYQDISQAPLDSESAAVLAALQTSGWGGKLGIDFSFEINQAADNVARRAFTPYPGDQVQSDCDFAPVPLVPGGKTEGSPTGDYACADGDCHLLVYQGTRLYELYRSDVGGGMASGGDHFYGDCLVIWDLTHDYWVPTAPPNFSRGDGCNGADAGDFPIAPLLLTKEELAANKVTHAMRFTINNNRIRKDVYVHPMTHIGGPSGGATTLPYGARLRLRADYDLSKLPNDTARAIAKALQTYGMFLADGGNIYISATTDASDAVSGSALGALLPSDFEMVDGGARINWHDQNCLHTQVTN